MGKISLIIEREYLTRVKKKSFIIMTFLGPLLMAGIFIGAIFLSLAEEGTQKIIVVDEVELFHDLPSSSNVQFDYTTQSIEEVKKNFHQSDYNAILYIPFNILKGNTVMLFFKKQPGFGVLKYVDSKLESKIEDVKLSLNKIDKASYLAIKTDLNITTISFKEQGKEEKSNKEAGFVGLFFAILIYMFIFLYGVQVMRGVIEEKTSRIVEVIISSVKPFQLMLGKIIGVALVGLTQFLLWIMLTTGIIAIAQTFILKDKYNVEQISNMNMSSQLLKETQQQNQQVKLDSNDVMELVQRINFPYMLGLFIFYFLGGYLLYSALFAAIGAASDSDSDTQQFMLPVTIPLIFGFVVAQMSIQNPDGPAAVWFSIIPLTSPVVMMVRIATVPFEALFWDLILSMVLLVLGFLFITWIAAKVYRTGILMYGKKVNYKEIWKWMFYKG